MPGLDVSEVGFPHRETRDWSVYDRPELRDAVALAQPGGRREALLTLEGMHCAGCVARARKLLGQFDADVRINLTAKTAEIGWDASRTPLSRILSALDAADLGPRVLAQEPDLALHARERRAAQRRIGVAILGSMQVMMLAWPSYFHAADLTPSIALLLRYAQWLFATPVVLYAGWTFFRSAWLALSQRTVNMDVPVALALGVAYLASAFNTAANTDEVYFDTATMFVLLLAIGRYLEGRTRAIAGARLRKLAGQRALTASRITADGLRQVPITALAVGDRVQVAPGEAVPVDGSLVQPAAELDESLLTGEARPVAHQAGGRVLAGSINVGAQALELQVTAVGAETALSQIARLLHRAQSERPAFVQLADQAAGGFIAAVLLLASAAAWYWAMVLPAATVPVALAVLVASCPCALALAVPTVFAAASSHLAAQGVLLARPQALSRLPDVDAVLFDKTGTLTHGDFEITAVHTLAGEDAGHCLQLAAALELGGIHPIARAFARAATPLKARAVSHEPGQGVHGEIGGQRYWLGAPEQSPLTADHAGIAARMAANPHLTWVLLTAQQPLALFGLSAIARLEAEAVVRKLAQSDLHVELLSGDSLVTAQQLAHRLGIRRVAGRQSPTDKLARLRALQAQGQVVMAVGDGINDAPLLAAADVAVVMPSGAALAQARADAVLIGDSLHGLPLLLQTGARARRLFRQNIAWALLYNLAVLPAAAAGLLSPWLAALGMSLSSLLVVGNALRVLAPSRRRQGPAQAAAELC